MVDGVEEDAADAVAAGVGALCQGAEIVDIHVGVGEGRAVVAGDAVGCRWAWGVEEDVTIRRKVRRNGRRVGLKWVTWGVPMLRDERVGDVSNGFGGGAEVGSTFRPAHGKDEGEGDKGFLRGEVWERDGEERGVGWAEPNAVISVGNVGFDHEDGAVMPGSKVDCADEAIEGVAKLHGKLGRKAGGVVVDAVEGEVDDDAVAAVALGHDANGGESQVGEMADERVW